MHHLRNIVVPAGLPYPQPLRRRRPDIDDRPMITALSRSCQPPSQEAQDAAAAAMLPAAASTSGRPAAGSNNIMGSDGGTKDQFGTFYELESGVCEELMSVGKMDTWSAARNNFTFSAIPLGGEVTDEERCDILKSDLRLGTLVRGVYNQTTCTSTPMYM